MDESRLNYILKCYEPLSARQGDELEFSNYLFINAGLHLPLMWPVEYKVVLASERRLSTFGLCENVCTAGNDALAPPARCACFFFTAYGLCRLTATFLFFRHAGKYVCCGERLVAFGHLSGATHPEEKYRFVFAVGSSTKGVYCYDVTEDAVFLAGNSFESFAKDGLRRVDPIYMICNAPSKIRSDDALLDLLSCGNNFDEIVKKMPNLHGRMYDVESVFRGLDTHLVLVDGDPRGVPLAMEDEMFLTDTENFKELFGLSMILTVSKRMGCMHYVIGLLGAHTSAGFVLRLYIMIDKNAVVYGFDRYFNRICRLADGLTMFSKIMGLKSIYNFRYDRGDVGLKRLEKPPVCFHPDRVPSFVDVRDGMFALADLKSFGQVYGCSVFFPTHVDGCGEGTLLKEISVLNALRYHDIMNTTLSIQRRKGWTARIWADEFQALVTLLARFGIDHDVRSYLVKILEAENAAATVDDDAEDYSSGWVGFIMSELCSRCVHRFRKETFTRDRKSAFRQLAADQDKW